MSDVKDKLSYIQKAIDDVECAVHKLDKDLLVQKTILSEQANKTEQISLELKRTNDLLEANTEDMRIHIQRTNLLQDILTKMESRLLPLEVEAIQKKAVKDFIKNQAILITKICGAIVAVGALFSLLKPIVVTLLLHQK